MLNQFFEPGIILGIAQAAVAALFALLLMLLARQRQVHVERETIIALLRGFSQIVLVGSILLLLLQGPFWVSYFVLAAMITAAASIAARRARGIPGAFKVSLVGIGLGAGIVILAMSLFGVIDTAVTSLIPVGSMVIANAMNTNALALDRYQAEVKTHRGQIEAALALGADPKVTVTPYVQAAVQASLIPRLDSLSSLGIVWIPGLMTGMILAGSDPIYAAIYQFAVLAMIFFFLGLTAVTSTQLIRTYTFSPDDQLIIQSQTVKQK